MKGRTIIKKDGRIITEVLERQGDDCKDVTKLTQGLGKQTREDVTGPDCDVAHETHRQS